MSLEFNKAAGALLGTLTFVLGVGFIGELVFSHEMPEKPGFEVAVAETAPTEAAPAEEAAVEPIAVRLASADAAKGEAAAKVCLGCHSVGKGEKDKAGPNLYGLVGRKPGSHEGYAYDKQMIDFGSTQAAWDYEALDAFITNPKAVVPGTKMGYAGNKKPDERANIIAYLRTLADTPAPLPTP